MAREYAGQERDVGLGAGRRPHGRNEAGRVTLAAEGGRFHAPSQHNGAPRRE